MHAPFQCDCNIPYSKGRGFSTLSPESGLDLVTLLAGRTLANVMLEKLRKHLLIGACSLSQHPETGIWRSQGAYWKCRKIGTERAIPLEPPGPTSPQPICHLTMDKGMISGETWEPPIWVQPKFLTKRYISKYNGYCFKPLSFWWFVTATGNWRGLYFF